MNQELMREFCLTLPHSTERVQWGDDLLFCVGNKMFAVLPLDAASPYCFTFKCTPEKFAELTELQGIDPAPYVARYHWVALRRFDALPPADLKRLVQESHRMVFEKLPSKVKASLARKSPAATAQRGRAKKEQ